MGRPCRRRNECIVLAEWNNIPRAGPSDSESTAWKPGQRTYFSLICDRLTDSCAQTALAIGAFSTTLTTLGFALMEFRGLTITNVFIGNFFFVAGLIFVLSASDVT